MKRFTQTLEDGNSAMVDITVVEPPKPRFQNRLTPLPYLMVRFLGKDHGGFDLNQNDLPLSVATLRDQTIAALTAHGLKARERTKDTPPNTMIFDAVEARFNTVNALEDLSGVALRGQKYRTISVRKNGNPNSPANRLAEILIEVLPDPLQANVIMRELTSPNGRHTANHNQTPLMQLDPLLTRFFHDPAQHENLMARISTEVPELAYPNGLKTAAGIV